MASFFDDDYKLPGEDEQEGGLDATQTGASPSAIDPSVSLIGTRDSAAEMAALSRGPIKLTDGSIAEGLAPG